MSWEKILPHRLLRRSIFAFFVFSYDILKDQIFTRTHHISIRAIPFGNSQALGAALSLSYRCFFLYIIYFFQMVVLLLSFLLRLTKVAVELSNDDGASSTLINLKRCSGVFTTVSFLPAWQAAFKSIGGALCWSFVSLHRSGDAGVQRRWHFGKIIVRTCCRLLKLLNWIFWILTFYFCCNFLSLVQSIIIAYHVFR